MGLNTNQQLAYDTVLSSSESIITLIGAAGTGKTYTVSEIIKAFPGTIHISATTHRAKQVISNMSEQEAMTTQSKMKFIMSRNGKEQFLTPNPNPEVYVEQCDLLIIEETSMLPLNIYNSIVEHIENGTIGKALFLGDAIQLPPVGRGVDIDAIPGPHIELVEQMRQDPDPILLSYLGAFRDAIKNNDTSFVMNTNLPDNIKFISDSHTEFCRAYKRAEGTKKIIAFTNATVNAYNKHIHGTDAHFLVGDEVVIDKPLGFCQNGDTVLIKEITEHPDYYHIVVAANGQRIKTRYYKTKQALEAYLNEAENTTEYWNRFDRCIDYKHLYACTTFKAQGATIDHVFVDMTDIYAQHAKKPTKWNNYTKPISFELFLRHAYVAITRMAKSATIYIGNNRTYRGFRR
jgi:ATP-dependent exoDNAse (exonuclease V) alpha subunit